MVVPPAKVYISDSAIPDAGRGVFASEDILEGEIIETAPVVVLPQKDYRILARTKLLTYGFNWTDEKDQVAIVLGWGSMYNHSYRPNAVYSKDRENFVFLFTALKEIKKGEEITVNYNNNPDDKSYLGAAFGILPFEDDL
jgi:SET domain-containing protein